MGRLDQLFEYCLDGSRIGDIDQPKATLSGGLADFRIVVQRAFDELVDQCACWPIGLKIPRLAPHPLTQQVCVCMQANSAHDIGKQRSDQFRPKRRSFEYQRLPHSNAARNQWPDDRPHIVVMHSQEPVDRFRLQPLIELRHRWPDDGPWPARMPSKTIR